MMNDMTLPCVRLVNLRKNFGAFQAVNDVSLDVQRGEFLTFLGSSGSGKTTTLNMIAGFDDPSDGEIWLDGRPVTGLPPQHRNIGMVFQRYTLFPHMTVAENVAFPLSVRGTAREVVREKVRDVLRLVQLEPFADRLPAKLSGGQQQRVALARALVYEPALLLMDEPLGALDKKLREEIQLELRKLHQRLKVTIIYVTHDQEEALRLSDRIAVFSGGRIVQVGSGEDLYERPADAFIAGFIGNSNFLRGQVLRDGGDSLAVRLSDEETVTLPAAGAFRAGEGIRVMVRPEDIEMVATSGHAGDLSMRVTVTERIFLGDVIAYEVRTQDGQDISVRQPASRVAGRLFEIGNEAFVSAPAQRCHVFR
jgi:putative spermidine/putrescine transport system ATP-binding protein